MYYVCLTACWPLTAFKTGYPISKYPNSIIQYIFMNYYGVMWCGMTDDWEQRLCWEWYFHNWEVPIEVGYSRSCHPIQRKDFQRDFKLRTRLTRRWIDSPPINKSSQSLKMSLMAPPPVSNGTGLFIGAAAVVIIWFYAFSRGGYVTKDNFQWVREQIVLLLQLLLIISLSSSSGLYLW